MRSGRRIVLGVLAAAIGVWLAVAAATSFAATTHANNIKENNKTHKYHYTPITMTITKGDTIVWNDKSDSRHTITFNDGSFNMKIKPGKSVSRTFAKTGTFKYHCNVHSYMHGTVVVQ